MPDGTCFSLSDGTLVRPADPFFITGSGRCGTTLMRRLVIERTGAVIPPENYILALSSRLLQMAGGDWGAFCRLVLAYLQKHAGRWEDFGIAADTAVGLLSTIPGDCRSIANFWHAFHAIYAVGVGKPDDTQWGDKTPANVDALPEIIAIFPQARFVFMVRDVFDTAWSHGSMSVHARSGDFLGGAQRWVDANTRILAFAEGHAAQAIIVRYEDLARFPEDEVTRVLHHLGTPAAGGALNALEARDMAEQPYLKNVLQEVSGGSIGKGRANLTDAIRQDIAALGAALQTRLGYDPTGAHPLPTVADGSPGG